MTPIEYIINLSFLIGSAVAIVLLAVLWFALFRKKTKRPYPIAQMLSVALLAQGIGIFAFLT